MCVMAQFWLLTSPRVPQITQPSPSRRILRLPPKNLLAFHCAANLLKCPQRRIKNASVHIHHGACLNGFARDFVFGPLADHSLTWAPLG